jgi:ATP-dependent Clp protease ATP-binding subunit ClpB
MQCEILNQLSKEILAGRVSKDDVVGITLNDGKEIGFMNLSEIEIE